jgi:anti-sigma regulatory factor (Ser/Thr protein kinase)
MIEIAIDIPEPRLSLRLPAEPDSLPVARQALRSLGDAVKAEQEALEDAELALSEACANVVEHAYGGAPGEMDVTFEPVPTEIVATVGDRGVGIQEAGGHGGFGLAVIEGIAKRMEVRNRPGGGTEVVMSLDMGGPLSLNGSAPIGAAPLERVARRIVAVVAAQADLPSDRLVESLLAVELAARHAPTYVQGELVELMVERHQGGFELLIGPLVANGASALVKESDLPTIGPVIERFADHIEFERDEPDTERLRLRVGSASG